MIETERLLLEPLDVSRLEEFVALTRDGDTMRYWSPRGAFSRDMAERNFAASLARLREYGFGRRWIVEKESGAGLGFTETKYFGEGCDDVSPDEVEIGWMLAPPARDHGYATEAGSAVRDEAFVRLGLDSIVAMADSPLPHNPSAMVVEALAALNGGGEASCPKDAERPQRVPPTVLAGLFHLDEERSGNALL